MLGSYLWSMVKMAGIVKEQFRGFKQPDGGTVALVMVGITVMFLYLFAQITAAIWKAW